VTKIKKILKTTVRPREHSLKGEEAVFSVKLIIFPFFKKIISKISKIWVKRGQEESIEDG
jgi:hypothetical protein